MLCYKIRYSLLTLIQSVVLRRRWTAINCDPVFIWIWALTHRTRVVLKCAHKSARICNKLNNL